MHAHPHYTPHTITWTHPHGFVEYTHHHNSPCGFIKHTYTLTHIHTPPISILSLAHTQHITHTHTYTHVIPLSLSCQVQRPGKSFERFILYGPCELPWLSTKRQSGGPMCPGAGERGLPSRLCRGAVGLRRGAACPCPFSQQLGVRVGGRDGWGPLGSRPLSDNWKAPALAWPSVPSAWLPAAFCLYRRAGPSAARPGARPCLCRFSAPSLVPVWCLYGVARCRKSLLCGLRLLGGAELGGVG